jgi:DNA-binding transcriptional MerR regulator
MKIDNRLYESKDLKRILGLKPETIYLWLGTYHIFEPTERATGIRGKNKYSLLDLVKLGLIANLQANGVHLSHVRGIIAGLDKDENGENLWEKLVNERERFDKDGATLIVFMDQGLRVEEGPRGVEITRLRWREPHYRVRLLSYCEAAKQLKLNVKAPVTRLIVPIGWIVRLIEERTHERQGQRKGEKVKEQ